MWLRYSADHGGRRMKVYDPRSIANAILDLAKRDQIPITSVVLQKLLYFAHGLHLVRYGKPLVSGYFEAWKFGPVHSAVYHAFRSAKADPITFRAKGKDPLTGKEKELLRIRERKVLRLLEDVVAECGKLSVGDLIKLSHAKKGPWGVIEEQSRHSIVVGMRIPDDVIIECFQHHKIRISEVPHKAEGFEDVPLYGIAPESQQPAKDNHPAKIARN